MFEGQLEGICVADNAGEDMKSIGEVQAIAGKGLAADRYAEGRGAFQKSPAEPNRQVTLIEQEALEGASAKYGLNLQHPDTRRNLLTCGVPLNHLVGRDFLVGDVILRGHELCEPCGYLEDHTYEGIKAALKHRGGLCAEILQGGLIKVGDVIRQLGTD